MSLGTWRLQADLAAARAEIERLNNGLTDAACQISDLASRLGRAEGRLDASELVGVVEGWKARAEKAESERDEARAQVARHACRKGERHVHDHAHVRDAGPPMAAQPGR